MRLLLLIAALALVSCAPVKTRIYFPDETVVVEQKAGSLVEATDEKGRSVKVDDRGRPSFLENLINAMTLQAIEED